MLNNNKNKIDNILGLLLGMYKFLANFVKISDFKFVLLQTNDNGRKIYSEVKFRNCCLNCWSYLAQILSPTWDNKKKSILRKISYFLIFQKIELSGSNIKKILIFSYILGNRNPEKISSYFRKRKRQKISHILGDETF